MEITDVGRPVAKHTDGNVVIAGILVTNGKSGGNRQVAADDGMSAPHVLFRIGHVHGSALALRHTGRLAQ